MNRTRLIARSVAYRWRSQLGVMIGAAIACAVLTGALIVGDSVQHMLRTNTLARIGDVDLALAGGDRFFRADLADRLDRAAPDLHSAPVLFVRGVASSIDGGHVARNVNILGVDNRFFSLAPEDGAAPDLTGSQALLSESLRQQLQASRDDSIVVRIERPSALPRDTALGAGEDQAVGLRVTVRGTAGDDAFGRFSFQADQLPPRNLFVSLDWLQRQLDIGERANVLLIDTRNDDLSVEPVVRAIDAAFDFRDAQLELIDVADTTTTEMRSDRIFIDRATEDIVAAADVDVTGFLTYFVNSIERGELATPYSMVTAIGALPGGRPADLGIPELHDLAGDDIAINQWLADKLLCAPGDTITLRYFVLDDRDRLVETSSDFVVRAIVPMTGLANDRTLMPDFPGIAEAERSSDWSPGIPIDLERIKDEDEAYWEAHRGTPKAFIALATGKTLWGNRYGALTAVRFAQSDSASLADRLSEEITPDMLGLEIREVRASALRAGRATSDFGGLFLGLSCFLIVAAILLTSLLFVFNTEQRIAEVGTLRAIGFTRAGVRRMLLAEGCLLATLGSVVGAFAGVAYTGGILAGLRSVWREAVAAATVQLHVSPVTLVMGCVITVIVAAIAMHFTLARIARHDLVAQLAGDLGEPVHDHRARRSPIISAIVGAIALVAGLLIALTTPATGQTAPLAFFAAGACMLLGGLLGYRVLLLRLRRSSGTSQPSLHTLAIRNASRRTQRSVATAALLACGVFLVLSIVVHRIDAHRDADQRHSGTGGFAFIGESTMRIPLDLNTARGRDAYAIAEDDVPAGSVVSMRMRDGDEASCLNLNRAQNPRLLSVDPEALATREAFTFARFRDGADPAKGWRLLDDVDGNGSIPAIVDQTSAQWAMHRSVGDTLEYTDEQGQPVTLVIVATVASSILQGNVIIAEEHFRRLFPSEDGYRVFLLDVAGDDRTSVARRVQRSMSDVGLELTEAPARLAEFSTVQNTYLAIFQLLGGIGLLLGTTGLGIVVVRNVLERRRELSVLRALGYRLPLLRRLIVEEHGFVLLAGLLCGAVAAGVAVIPSLSVHPSEFPMRFTLLVLALLVANGMLWVWLATQFSVSHRVLQALSREVE